MSILTLLLQLQDMLKLNRPSSTVRNQLPASFWGKHNRAGTPPKANLEITVKILPPNPYSGKSQLQIFLYLT